VGLTSFFTMGGFEVAWSLHLRSVGASMTTISLLWVAFSVPMLFSFAGGMLADRYSRFLLMFAGNIVAAFGFIAIGVVANIPFFFVISVVQGLAVAVAMPAKQGLLIEVSPPRWIGTVTGLDQTSMQLGGLIGSLLVPVIYGAVSGLAFAVCGAVSLVGLALAAPVLGRESRRLRRAPAAGEEAAGAS
jgi:MFS family permease